MPDTPPVAPSAPEAIPVPQLDAQPPEGEIVGLASPEPSPAPSDALRGRRRSYPIIPGESAKDRKARLKRERKARARAEREGKTPPAGATPPPAKEGPKRAPGVPFPDELGPGGELGELAQLPDGVTREELEELAGSLGLTFSVLMGLVAGRLGAHWAINDAEAGKLGKAWAPVLAPYMKTLGEGAPWVMAATTTAMVLAPHAVAHFSLPRGEVVPEVPSAQPPAPKPEPEPPAEGVPPREPTGAGPAVGGNVIKPPKNRPVAK